MLSLLCRKFYTRAHILIGTQVECNTRSTLVKTTTQEERHPEKLTGNSSQPCAIYISGNRPILWFLQCSVSFSVCLEVVWKFERKAFYISSFFWPWCESNCPRCDGYKTWRCIQEIYTRRDTNCQHISKFTTLTKPRPYSSAFGGLSGELMFRLPCLAFYICWWNARKWKSALQLGAENPTYVQIPKPTIVGTNENIFRESSTLMSFLFPHSAIHQFT